jgi:hypothetical protein
MIGAAWWRPARYVLHVPGTNEFNSGPGIQIESIEICTMPVLGLMGQTRRIIPQRRRIRRLGPFASGNAV